jgi:nucleoside-diphosphate-sugar epimerase
MSKEPARILISGAFGQVGQRVVALLLGRDRTVIALDLSNDANEALAKALAPRPGDPGTLIPAFANLLDAEAVQTIVGQHRPEVIVHLAALLAPACYRNPAMAHRVNVEGTANLVNAARALDDPPAFIECSSAAVYGSRNPHTHAGRLTADTPVSPIDCYGEDKVIAERIVARSSLPHAILRLAGVMSPDMLRTSSGDDAVLAQAVPRDNRIHMVDARDVALAFANAVDRTSLIDGKTLMIAGDETCVLVQQDMVDDLTQATGIGRLGPWGTLPGDPDDDQGWFLTDWFDTSEAQALLAFQQHTWKQTLDDLAASLGRRRLLNRCLGPLVRPLLRLSSVMKRRRAGRGPYADPWKLIAETYGPDVLASPPADHSDVPGNRQA